MSVRLSGEVRSRNPISAGDGPYAREACSPAGEHASRGDAAGWLQAGGLVAFRVTFEDHEIGLQGGWGTLGGGFAADAGLLVAAKADAEVGPVRVVAPRAGTEPAADFTGPVDVV